jgi:xylulokinase
VYDESSYDSARGRSVIFVIGCDVGTQSTKAILLDDEGRVAGRGARSYPVSHPHPGWSEQDPAAWLGGVGGAIADAVRDAGRDPAECAAIGIAAQLDGIVAVDAANRPLGPAPIWMDRRAVAELAAAEDRMDADRIRALTGANADPSHGAPKIAWLREHLATRPDGYLLPASWVVASLTGVRTVDPANASCLLLLDLERGAWSPDLLAAFDVDPDALPAVRPATDVAGPLLGDVARAWGMPACPVVVGTGDEHAACVAAGILQPGLIGDIVGTAEPVAATAATPVRDPAGLVETHAHVPAGRFLVEHPGFVSAGSVRWLAEDVLGVDQPEIGRLAAGAPAGADGVGFLAALGGAMTPRWDPAVLGTFSGLSSGHDRTHLARAVLEGCSYAVRDVVERLAELGLGGDTIRVVGGGARDATWLRIKADVTGRRVERLAEPEATALGAALIAATGIGWFADLDAASAATLRLADEVLEPDPANRAVYDDGWAAHRARFEVLAAPSSTMGSMPAMPA